MTSSQDFVSYVCEQSDLDRRVSTKRMFGEYALYVDAKVVAFICDNQVFVKPTDAGKTILGAVFEAPPYPGAKAHFQVNEHLDDRDLLRSLLLATAHALPAPAPKARRSRKAAQAKVSALATSKGNKAP